MHKLHPFILVFALSLFLTTLCTAQPRSLITNDRLTLGTETNRSASVRMGDIDADGDLDLAVANGRHWPQQNFLFSNTGKSKFPIMVPLGSDRRTTYACELADLDGDGDLDIATGNDMARGKILLNDGQGRFTDHAEFGEISSLRSLIVVDIDGDGDVDLLATSRGKANRIYLNDGNANFKSGPHFGRQDDSTIDVAVADLNEDGHLDLVLANRDAQPNEILFGDERLGFSQSIPFGADKDNSRAIAVADMNDDGKLDLIVGNIGQSNRIHMGDGTGKFRESCDFGAADGRTYSLAVADMDKDGNLDIVASNVGQSNFVYFNSGDGTKFQALPFRHQSPKAPSSATYGLCIGDLNGDQFPDIVTANSDGLNHIYLNVPARKK